MSPTRRSYVCKRQWNPLTKFTLDTIKLRVFTYLFKKFTTSEIYKTHELHLSNVGYKIYLGSPATFKKYPQSGNNTNPCSVINVKRSGTAVRAGIGDIPARPYDIAVITISNLSGADYVPKCENHGVADSGVSISSGGSPDGRHLDKGDPQERVLRDDDLQRDHKQRVDPGDRDRCVQRQSVDPEPGVRRR